MNEFVTWVSNMGFPIVACGCLGLYIKKTMENQEKSHNEDKERLYGIIDKYNENLGKACEVLDRLEGKLDILKDKNEK